MELGPQGTGSGRAGQKGEGDGSFGLGGSVDSVQRTHLHPGIELCACGSWSKPHGLSGTSRLRKAWGPLREFTVQHLLGAHLSASQTQEVPVRRSLLIFLPTMHCPGRRTFAAGETPWLRRETAWVCHLNPGDHQAAPFTRAPEHRLQMARGS